MSESTTTAAPSNVGRVRVARPAAGDKKEWVRPVREIRHVVDAKSGDGIRRVSDGSKEAPFLIAYPFPEDEYPDPERTDFATQMLATLSPIVEKWNTAHPNEQVKLVPVNIDATYDEGMVAFAQRIDASGLLKTAPAAIRHNVASWLQHRHPIENVDYKRRDRAALEKMSHTGRLHLAAGGKPLDDAATIRKKKKEEARTVRNTALRQYVFDTLKERSLSVSAHLKPLHVKPSEPGQPHDLVVDGWELRFASHDEFKAFFAATFPNEKLPRIKEQDRVRALAEKVSERLGLDAQAPNRQAIQACHTQQEVDLYLQSHAAQERAKQATRQTLHGFQRLQDIQRYLQSQMNLQAHEVKINDFEVMVRSTPLGKEILQHAADFRQDIWEAENSHADVPQEFTLRFDENLDLQPEEHRFFNGARGQDLSTKDETRFRVSLGDNSASVEFARGAAADGPFAVALTVRDAQGGTERTLADNDPAFKDLLLSRFPAPLLQACFGGREVDQLRQVGSFREVLGRARSAPKMERRIEQSLYREIAQAFDKRWQDVGDPIGLHAGGDSYNQALYGENLSNEAHAVVQDVAFAKGDKGDMFNSGSCGHHQRLVSYFNYHVDAHQEGGPTYRYNPRGGDPFDDFKLTYMSVILYTRTAGAREKMLHRGEEEGYVRRDVGALDIPLNAQALSRFTLLDRDDKGNQVDESIAGQFQPIVRDSQGQALYFSEFLEVSSVTDLDGHVIAATQIDPAQAAVVTMTEDTPVGAGGKPRPLLDDLGRAVNDNGKPVTQLETVTLVATLDDKPVTAASIAAKRLEIEMAIRAAPDSRPDEDAIRWELEQRLQRAGAGSDREAMEAAVRAEFEQRRDQRIGETVEKALYASIRYRAARVERWVPAPLWQTEKDGKPIVKDGLPVPLTLPVTLPDGTVEQRIAYTYEKKLLLNPTQQDLYDAMVARIRSVHGQEGRLFPHTPQVVRPGLIVSGRGIARGGDEFDTPLRDGYRSSANRSVNRAFGAFQQGMLLERSTIDAVEDERGTKETQQSHNDMGDKDLRVRFEDDGQGGKRIVHTIGEDPLVPRQIAPGLAAESLSVQDGFEAAIKSGIGLRNRRTTQRQLKRNMKSVAAAIDANKDADSKQMRDLAESAARGEALDKIARPQDTQAPLIPKWEAVSNSLASQLDAVAIETQRAVYGGLQLAPPARPSADAPKPLERTWVRTTAPDHPLRSRQFGAADSVLAPAKKKRLVPEDIVGQCHAALEATKQLVDQLLKDLDDDGIARFNMDDVMERFFRSPRDRFRWAMTTESKAACGTFLATDAVGEGIGTLTLVPQLTEAVEAFGFVGHALLAVAGLEGMKSAGIEMLKSGRLIRALKEYQGVLQEAQKEVDAAGQDASQVLQGVTARLAAAKRHFVDNCVNAVTSASLAGAGALGIVGDAIHAAETALEAQGLALPASLGLAADITGMVGGGLVMGFGAVTAAQAGAQMYQRQDVKNKVRQALGGAIDNAFGYAMITLAGHQEKALKRELFTRLGLTAAGAASVALGGGGAAGAAFDPTGASAASMVVGAATGILAHLAFRQFLSRHRGLLARPGVERTPNLPVGYLNDLSQLADTASMLNNEMAIWQNHLNKMVDRDLKGAGDKLSSPRYMMRVHQILKKPIPDHGQSYLMAQMRAHPQQIASTSHQWMLRMTDHQTEPLAKKVLPDVKKEHQRLRQKYSQLDRSAANAKARRACAADLRAMSQLLVQETSRLDKLRRLREQLENFSHHLQTEFLRDDGLRRQWDELRADFIIGHGMVGEALSRGNLTKLNRQVQADQAADADALVRKELLRKPLDVRFAKVFVRWPDKRNYERNAVLAIGLEMLDAILAAQAKARQLGGSPAQATQAAASQEKPAMSSTDEIAASAPVVASPAAAI